MGRSPKLFQSGHSARPGRGPVSQPATPMREFLRRKITKDQSRDTGMALVLLGLIGYALSIRREGLLFTAVALHIVNMTAPQVYRPLAVIWFGFSELAG